MSTIQQKLQDLSSGYIKEEFIAEENDKWPLELNKIVMDFVGNIFIKFDLIPNDKCERFLGEGRKLVTIGDEYLRDANNFGCSYCMTDGVTFIDVECVGTVSSSNVIGILSNIDEFKLGRWIAHIRGYKYWWYNMTAIFGEKDTKDIATPNRLVPAWKPGDVISLKIDLNEWKITFYVNKEEKHQIELQQNISYYFVMVLFKNSGYRIL